MSATCVADPSRPQISVARVWLAVVVLGIATFAIVTTEFMPIGLLSQIASGLQGSSASVGLTVTLYAWIGAASALVSAMLLGRLPIRPLLVVLMLVASNAAAAFAPDFAVLLGARALGAVAHGFFWAMVAAVAVRIAPPGQMGLATSIVFGGITVATVLGVPLANVIGESGGWRTAFGTMAALCTGVAVLMSIVLPRVSADGAVGARTLLGVLGNRPLRRVYVVALFSVAAHFGAFTFVEPYLRALPGLPYARVAALLFGFGAAGFAGNIATGLLIDRHLERTTIAALVALGLTLIVLGLFASRLGLASAALLVAVWGVAFAVLMVGLQTWVLRSAGAEAMPALAVYTAVFNMASGVGAMLGACIFDRSGVPAIMTSAGIATAAATFIALRRSR